MTSPARLCVPFYRHRGRRVTFADVPRAGRMVVRRPARIARQIALAHHIQRAIDRGILAGQSDVARRLGLTTARVTQVMNLLLLAPELQEQLLFLEAVDGVEPASEKQWRSICACRPWSDQRARCST